MKIKIPRNLKRIENPLGFTIMEVAVAVLGVAFFSASIYLFYLVIMALRKYISS